MRIQKPRAEVTYKSRVEAALHAPLAPSAAHRWTRCAGSVRVIAALPERPPNVPSVRGTYMHNVLKACLDDLKRRTLPDQWIGKTQTIDSLPVEFDEDMATWTQEALSWVWTYLDKHPKAKMWTEQRLKTGHALDPNLAEDIWGTADVIIWTPTELVVLDLKGGYLWVDVEDNDQLNLYTIGTFHFLKEEHLDIPMVVRQVIHQPRQGGAREMVLTPDSFPPLARWYKERANAAKQPNAPLSAGVKQCSHCPAMGRCPEAQKQTLELATKEVWNIATTITQDQLVKIVSSAPYIRKLLTAAEGVATQMMVNGEQLTGLKLVQSEKHRKWKDEKQAVAKLKLLSVEPYKQVLITPAQAEQKLKNKELLEDLWFKPEGEPRIAAEDDSGRDFELKQLKVANNG